MEPKTTAALAYLEQDPLLHADMLAAIRRENADIRYAGPEGVLLIETGDRVPMLSMEDTVLASRLIRDCLPFGQVVVHQMSLLPCTRRAGLVGNAPCYQAVYTAQAPPEVSCPYPIAPLEESDLPAVLEHYQLIRDPEALLDIIRRGRLWGVRDGDTLMGFIGLHGEGSMGLLEVFPQYRRKGLALALEAFLIRWHLERGLTPYCQIFEYNTASVALQEKLGLSFAQGRIAWAIRREGSTAGP